MDAHEQGGEADKGGCRGAGIGAPGVRHVGEHVVVRVLEGDASLFVVAAFFSKRAGKKNGVLYPDYMWDTLSSYTP